MASYVIRTSIAPDIFIIMLDKLMDIIGLPPREQRHRSSE